MVLTDCGHNIRVAGKLAHAEASALGPGLTVSEGQWQLVDFQKADLEV